MDRFNPDTSNEPSAPVEEQTPHSGIHNDEFPVREYRETTLEEATQLPDFKSKLPTDEVVTVASFTGQSPETVEVIPETSAPQIEQHTKPEGKKLKLWHKAVAAAVGLGLAGGAAVGITSAINGSDHEGAPKPDDKATNQPSSPSPEQTTGTGEKDNAEIEALVATLDNEARTNPEAFMQRPLSERLLIRDKYQSQVAENAVAWTVHPEHFVINESPSVDDDGQTIINNNLIDGLGLARGFVAEPSDANGNKWTQDYVLGESFASTGLVLDAENPHAAELKARLDQTIETIKGLDVDFAPLSEDLIANSATNGDPVEIEGQQCPTKVIEVTTTTSTGTSDATVTMALFKYKGANGKEKNEWVKYSVVNH